MLHASSGSASCVISALHAGSDNIGEAINVSVDKRREVAPQWHRQSRFLQMAQCSPASICRNLQWREQLSDRSADIVYEVLASTPATLIIGNLSVLSFGPPCADILRLISFDILGPDILTFMLSGEYFAEIFHTMLLSR